MSPLSSITFESCVAELLLPHATPIITEHEIAIIRDNFHDDATRLIALKAFVAPRHEWAWRLAGGRSHPEFSEAQMVEANKYFERARPISIEKKQVVTQPRVPDRILEDKLKAALRACHRQMLWHGNDNNWACDIKQSYIDAMNVARSLETA